MSTPSAVETFYSQIWNSGDLAAIPTLLSRDFRFRGSLGSELRGHEAFAEYVRSVRAALADYHFEILDCVTEQKILRQDVFLRHPRGSVPRPPAHRKTCTLARSRIISPRWRTHFRIVGLGRPRRLGRAARRERKIKLGHHANNNSPQNRRLGDDCAAARYCRNAATAARSEGRPRSGKRPARRGPATAAAIYPRRAARSMRSQTSAH